MVALSFVVFALFVRRAHVAKVRSRHDLLASALVGWIAHPVVVWSIRLAALALFVVTILAGLFGVQNPYRNIAPTLVWIVWWVGLVYVQAFVGDIWSFINPWRTIYDVADQCCRRVARGRELSLRLPYPQALGAWPACLLLLAFAWIELIYPGASVPRHIACLAIAYSILTWTGTLAFGRDAWLRHGEVFTLAFGTLARFAPTEGVAGRLHLRPFGAGLLDGQPVSTSMVAFVLLLLAIVLYDGLSATGEWAMLVNALRPMLPDVDGKAMVTAIKTAGLLAISLVFLTAYIGVSAVMSMVAGGRPGTLDVARAFALTLVPIAIGYHVAHYLAYLITQGQLIIPLLSDPFGYGWNLIGTAGYRVDIGLVGARFAWYAAVVAIVGGHVGAVYLAHVRAVGVFANPGIALRTQVPLTALMVVYTFIGLSITAEPIVESQTTAAPPTPMAAESTVNPPDPVAPKPKDGEPSRP